MHLIQWRNNGQACFYVDDDYQFYLGWLQTNKKVERDECKIAPAN